MSRDFGQLLEEARTRQRISIREAADATKIRGDFLEAFETKGGDFNMPNVYKRGFLRLYAEYLKLDQQEISEAFDAYQRGTSRQAKKQNKETLGLMDLQEESEMTRSVTMSQGTLPLSNASKKEFSSNSEESSQHKEEVSTKKEPIWDNLIGLNKNQYIKIGGIFAASLAIVVLVAVIASNWGSSIPDLNPNLQAQTQTEVAELNAFVAEEPEELFLLSSGEVHVVVQQELDKKRIFSGTIESGDRVSLTRRGPVKIHFSNGMHLTIETASGEKVKPAREGVGWVEIQAKNATKAVS